MGPVARPDQLHRALTCTSSTPTIFDSIRQRRGLMATHHSSASPFFTNTNIQYFSSSYNMEPRLKPLVRLHHFGMSTIRLPHAHTDHTKTCADRLPRPPALQDSGTTGSYRSATEPTSMPSDCNRTWRAIEQLAFAGFLNPTLLRRNSNCLCSHPSRMITLPSTNPRNQTRLTLRWSPPPATSSAGAS